MAGRRKYQVRKRADDPAGPYYVFWTEAGRQRKRSAGVFDQGLARALEDKLNLEEEERRVFGRSSAETNVTFAYAALAYLNDAEGEDERRGRAKWIERPIAELGDSAIRSLTSDAIKAAGKRAYPAVKPSTRRRQFYVPTMAVMRFGADEARQWCSVPSLNLPADDEARIDWIRPKAFAAILEASWKHARAPLAVAVGTGARASELARLEWEHVSLDGAEAWLWKSKTGKARKLELPTPAVVELANIKHRKGHVFRTPKRKPYVIRDDGGGLFDDALKGACERAGVPPISMHVLRHSFATWFYSATKDMLRLKTLGGWSSMRMIERYAHLAPRDLAEEVADYGWNFAAPSSANRPERAARPASALKSRCNQR